MRVILDMNAPLYPLRPSFSVIGCLVSATKDAMTVSAAGADDDDDDDEDAYHRSSDDDYACTAKEFLWFIGNQGIGKYMALYPRRLSY
jgi:hypothetical protein